MRNLVSYFRSGWVFLLPYLGLYLVYAWFKWPLNPGPAGGSGLRPPALLHLYWAVHALHLVLGGLLLAVRRRTLVAALARPWPWVPWACMALLFWLPGAYLEFPADPWEHFGRINRWKDVMVAGPETSWFYKAGSYFLAYSFLGHLPVTAQLAGLGVFAAAVALLLSWQYYRLAEACGLGSRPAMAFTLLQSVLLGNDIFGFYRYYGLSSSVFAQIGAVAAIRLAIEWSQARRPDAGATGAATPDAPPRPLVGVIGFAFAVGFATAHHLQGLGIAAFGLAAVLLWHAAKAGRKFLIPVLLTLAVAGVAGTLLWPRQPVIDAVYRTSGWLNTWGGFDLLSPESAAWRRMVLIIGLAGAVNVAAAVLLLRWNHIAGWLTLMPLIALQLAFVSIPLANLLGRTSPAGIVTFHRLFFAIPPGLALVVLGSRWLASMADAPRAAAIPVGGLLACAALVLIPADYPGCNRLWNAWARVPADLAMTRTLVEFHGEPGHPATRAPGKPLLVATSAISNVLQSYAPFDTLFITEERLLHSPVRRSPSADQERIRHFLHTHPSWGRPFVVLPADPRVLFTPQSQAAVLSRHWNSSEVALGFVR